MLFSLFEENQLVSRAEVIGRDVIISGCTYKTLGVCGVLTLPAYRQQGYGKHLIAALTAHIFQSDADIGMLFCRPELSRFYAANNWLATDAGATRIGTADNYRPCDMHRRMIFISQNAISARVAIATQPCYLESTW